MKYQVSSIMYSQHGRRIPDTSYLIQNTFRARGRKPRGIQSLSPCLRRIRRGRQAIHYSLSPQRRASARRGMTLIEMMVLISVLVIMTLAIVASLQYVYRGQRFAFEQADATRSARQGVERAVRDLREAAYADDGAYPVVSMATSSITFYSDANNDASVERIRYFLDGTNFKRGVTESSGDPPTYSGGIETVAVVSDNVRNDAISVPIFTYYDKGGTLMEDYTEVDELAFVVVRLVANLHPERAPEDYEVRSSAALRNAR